MVMTSLRVLIGRHNSAVARWNEHRIKIREKKSFVSPLKKMKNHNRKVGRYYTWVFGEPNSVSIIAKAKLLEGSNTVSTALFGCAQGLYETLHSNRENFNLGLKSQPPYLLRYLRRFWGLELVVAMADGGWLSIGDAYDCQMQAMDYA